MKKIISIALFIVVSITLFAQNEGISYQAVILDPNGQEIPGVDAKGNILPDAKVSLRFTILDSNNTDLYQEVQTTNTDQYGMINLLIGNGNREEFTKIEWDGTIKDLKVEIDFTGAGNNFVDMSRQQLLYVPYAHHRNITASGTLKVDDATDLNSRLTVGGPTNLNSSLSVNNNNVTNLTGSLNVDGATGLKDMLTVDGITNLNSSINVNQQSPSYFSGMITVKDTATFDGVATFNAPSAFTQISVNGPSDLKGQVKINTILPDGDSDINNYPLIIQGSQQGIAIKVNGSRSTDNNYVSFWDDDQMWGRIEGQTTVNLLTDPEYIYETASRVGDVAISTADMAIANVDIVIAGLDLGMSIVEAVQAGVELTARGTASTVCGGLGACVTAPPPSMIVSGAAKLVVAIANSVIVGVNLASTIANAVVTDVNLAKVVADGVAYQAFLHANIGVTYQSGAGDYAEWIPKADPKDVFSEGDIVGVSNGYITKTTSGAQKVMVISTRPIVLGNMPPQNDESNYEKIAFMGQVPVKVIGLVVPGDYILPNIIGSGFGVAVHPEDMMITDYNKIVGVAWSASEGNGLNYINVAVGMHNNEMNSVILNQETKINTAETEMGKMQQQINQLTSILTQLVPGFEDANKENLKTTSSQASIASPEANSGAYQKTNANTGYKSDEIGTTYVAPQSDQLIYFDIPREYIEEGINIARENYLSSSHKTLKEHPFWKRMEEEPAYHNEVVLDVQSRIKKALKNQMAIDKKLEYIPVPSVK